MIVKYLTDRGITLSYHTLGFILFFALFLLIFFVMQANIIRRGVILVGNLVFYYWMGGRGALVVVIATSLIVYAGAALMGSVYLQFERSSSGLTNREKKAHLGKYRTRARVFLILTLVLLFGILVYIKAGRLLHFPQVESVSDLRMGKILVPLGISYYTFSCAGYLLDIYWRKTTAEWNYFNLLLGITFFPAIVEGPICNYRKLFRQLKELPGADYTRVCFGMQRMIWGFFKKLVIADRLAVYSGAVFADPGSYAGVEIVLGGVANALALYADFSGCMDIVIGASECMGITLEENFRQPFFAETAAEFWRRWHITLGGWFKDYVYMPMIMRPSAMKRASEIRKKRGAHASQVAQSTFPLLIVWLLTGLWHGTGPDYVVWGLYWGFLIVLGMIAEPFFTKLEAFFGIPVQTSGWRFVRRLRTFFLFVIGRMLTATGSLEGFALVIRRLISSNRLWVLFDESLYTHGLDRKDFYVALLGLLILFVVDLLHEKNMKIRGTIAAQPLVLRWCVYLGAILFILVFGIYGITYDASNFAYAAF